LAQAQRGGERFTSKQIKTPRNLLYNDRCPAFLHSAVMKIRNGR
jgi:hypothetical protein